MDWLEEPNGKYGRWGQVGDSLLVFGLLAFVVVKVVLDWLVGAPEWALWVAVAVIAVFSVSIGFTVVDDEEDEVEIDELDADDNLVWKLDKPAGFWGWIRRLVSVWLSFAGMLLIFNELLLKEALNASASVRVWTGFVWLAFVLAIEFLDLVEIEPEAEQAAASSSSPQGL